MERAMRHMATVAAWVLADYLGGWFTLAYEWLRPRPVLPWVAAVPEIREVRWRRTGRVVESVKLEFR